jgi:hypothetical protein
MASPYNGYKEKVLDQYCTFMDNGVTADFEWLDATYPNARFAINSRGLKSWLVSRINHVKREHQKQKRSKTKKSSRGMQHYSRKGLVCEIIISATWIAHQQQLQIKYFNATEERRQRFAIVDVVGFDDIQLNNTLLWLARENLHDMTHRLETSTDAPGHIANTHSAVPVLGAAKDAHGYNEADSAETEKDVTEALISSGFPESRWMDLIWDGLTLSQQCMSYCQSKPALPPCKTYLGVNL